MDKFFQNDSDIKLFISLSNTPHKLDKYIVMLKNDFGYNLTKSELAQLLKKSEQTIDRRIKEGLNLPNYHRSGDGAKASYIFPIVEVAEYLANRTIKVA
jgi:predicted DNA-binding transcriptional regulator AlpA